MSRTRKSNPDFRHELSVDFVQALAADWKENGTAVIARVRQDSPDKYCELVAKTVPKEMLISAERGLDDFKDCQSQADIAINLLKQVGVPDGGATPSMIEAAVEAQLLFVETLERIAKGN
jgi:hypothetical protein